MLLSELSIKAGKNAKKKIVTFGFKTFIIKPCLIKLKIDFFGTLEDKSISELSLYVLKAR